MERVLKNADISVLGNFLATFFDFFSISRNFSKYYPHAVFQINWTIQTEITEVEGRICPPPRAAIPIYKKPGPFRVNGIALWDFCASDFQKALNLITIDEFIVMTISSG